MKTIETDGIYNPELQLAHDFVQFTGDHIFLTGKAGTGKTTFLHKLKELSPKRMIVVAPTGVAAINAGGVTIHSFFQVSFGPNVPGYSENDSNKIVRFSQEKRNIIKSLDLLVIDEISMVRADLLDSIDEVLRRFRRNSLPFGGVQLLMIGDMQQLPPVVRDGEWNLLRQYYQTPYFFSSLALKKTHYVTITLLHVYRQRDQHFIEMLNKIRDKQIDQKLIDGLKERYKPGFDGGDDNYIVLTTHNAKARQINASKLDQLRKKKVRFYAEIEGNFPEYNFPTETELELKVGAQVMFVKNDPDFAKRFYNGKIGVITKLNEIGVFVQCPDEEEEIFVSALEWQNIKYAIDEKSKEITESVEGSFIQIPLKLAWAITIHKSQGLTFDKVIIDSESAFAHGQVYVALSRCRSLEGLVLSTPFSPSGLRHDGSIDGFNKLVSEAQPDQQKLEASKAKFQYEVLIDLFTFTEIQYAINRLYNVLYDNQRSIQPELVVAVNAMKEPVKKEIIEVSNKFHQQITQYVRKNNNIEQNEDLQQRIKNAVGYFSDKIQKLILDEIDKLSFETDNKETKKAVGTALQRLEEETNLKLAALGTCKNGFVVKDFLNEKAKASLEMPAKKRSKKREKLPVSKEISNPELYNLLKKWRDAKANELDLSHYLVLSLKTMRALSNQVPSDFDELKRVHGLGKRKIEQYGLELLEFINAYRKNHDVIISAVQEEVPIKKEQKKNTKQISFELWQEYKDVEKVAAERDYAVSTILGHLAHFVGTGELAVTEFIDDEKVKAITEIFKENSDITLSEARSQSANAYSFVDLRFVQQHLVFEAKKNENP